MRPGSSVCSTPRPSSPELRLARPGAARPGAQLSVQLSGRGRGQPPARRAGLRGPALFPARLFRLEAGSADRLPPLQPRQPQQRAALRGPDDRQRASPAPRRRPGVPRGDAGGSWTRSTRAAGAPALRDEATDLYPIPLDAPPCGPGPSTRTPTDTSWCWSSGSRSAAGSRGLLLAVDAQPDNSVARKRFWEGTFLFAETPSAGPGFKAFRPLVRSGSAGVRAAAQQRARTAASGLPPYSTEQAGLAPADFYARMERLINPRRTGPRRPPTRPPWRP